MSKRPETGKVVVGDTVIVIPRDSQRGRRGPIRCAVVKTGRVLFDVMSEDPGRPLYTFETRFRMDTQCAAESRQTRFVTEAQYAWDREQQTARDTLKDAGVDTNPGWKGGPWNSGGRLLALAEFVRTYDAEHGADE